jgi:Protein phosphatase 2A regulatory B subunit (B56 family)
LSSQRKSSSNGSLPLPVCCTAFSQLLRNRLIIASETPPNERPQLFIKKLHQCHVLFDFNDASSELKGKQIKAQTLHEMLEYITTQRGVISESIYPEVIKMVRYVLPSADLS